VHLHQSSTNRSHFCQRKQIPQISKSFIKWQKLPVPAFSAINLLGQNWLTFLHNWIYAGILFTLQILIWSIDC